MAKEDYYNRPEWSYSQMKLILDSGIDFAVASREGLIPGPDSPAIDLGQLAHQLVLGGTDDFVTSPYTDYRTKEAREWRDAMKADGATVITQEQSDTAHTIANNIMSHPHAETYLTGKHVKHEVELYAKTADGVKLRGKADAIAYHDDGKTPKTITDIKTTAQFDKFFRSASSRHYDLQAAVYTLIAKTDFVNYYFCVAETVAPYRVQFMHASAEFLEAGERKLRHCVDEIIGFGERKPNFLLEEIRELGDYSW